MNIKQIGKAFVIFDEKGNRLGTYSSYKKARSILQMIKFSRSMSDRLKTDTGLKDVTHPRDPGGKWAIKPGLKVHRKHGQ